MTRLTSAVCGFVCSAPCRPGAFCGTKGCDLISAAGSERLFVLVGVSCCKTEDKLGVKLLPASPQPLTFSSVTQTWAGWRHKTSCSNNKNLGSTSESRCKATNVSLTTCTTFIDLSWLCVRNHARVAVSPLLSRIRRAQRNLIFNCHWSERACLHRACSMPNEPFSNPIHLHRLEQATGCRLQRRYFFCVALTSRWYIIAHSGKQCSLFHCIQTSWVNLSQGFTLCRCLLTDKVVDTCISVI